MTDPKAKAIESAEFGREIAAAIDDAVLQHLPDDSDFLTIYAHRLRLCNSRSNIWHATDLHNQHGELYNGSGRLWHCNLKLCPFCLARQAKQNRRDLRRSIEEQKLLVGEDYRFITLTIPNEGTSLQATRDRINYAWSLFRKRKYIRRVLAGGCKSEEFTVTSKGIHYHIHLLARSRAFLFATFRHHWTECLDQAYRREGRVLQVATADGKLWVNVKKVYSLRNAIQEVSKYITKSDSWHKIPKSDLFEICRIKRFPRMFELFGTFAKRSRRVAGEERDDDIKKTIVHTTNLSDGSTEETWREYVAKHGAKPYLDRLHDQYLANSLFRLEQLKRKFPYSTRYRLKSDTEPTPDDALLRLEFIHTERMRRHTRGKIFRFTKDGRYLPIGA